MSLTAKVRARFRLSECVCMHVKLKSLMMSNALTHTKAIRVIIHYEGSNTKVRRNSTPPIHENL
jgi:hypothetical protein